MAQTDKVRDADRIMDLAVKLAVRDFYHGPASDKLALMEHYVRRLLGDPDWKPVTNIECDPAYRNIETMIGEL